MRSGLAEARFFFQQLALEPSTGLGIEGINRKADFYPPLV